MMLVSIEIDESEIEIMDGEEQDSAVDRVDYGQNLHGSRFESLQIGEDEGSHKNEKNVTKEIEGYQVPSWMNNGFER